MDKKLIRRIATVVMACASVSVFAFVGCNKPDGHTHTPGEWQSNETKHWHVCADCDANVDEGNHTYDNDQDTDCNTCGYVRTVTPGGGTENPDGGTENPGGGTENPGGGTENPGGGSEKPGGGTENPVVDYTTGIHTLTFAGDADIFTSSINVASTDSGYNSTYFKVANGDYLYANMKLQKNKVIKVSGKAVTSNKTTPGKATNLGVSLKEGSTGAVSGLPSPINFTQEEGEKAFNFELIVTTEGDIVLAFTRDSGSTGCEITELKIEITDLGPVAVTGISLNKTTGALKVGETETLTATVTPANADNTNVVWSSSNTEIAMVDANGKVTALKAGEVTITATAEGDNTKTASCTYTVSNVAVTGISFATAGTKIGIGDEITLNATIAPANATIKTVSWASDKPEIATVENGVVKGVAVGTATITVTTSDGNKTATYTVEVLSEIVKVTGVAFANATGTANTETEEQTIQLIPIFTPDNATNKNVTWTSDNPTVASVDKNGLVTAHKKSGTAIITVTTEDGAKTATYTLTVEGPAITATTPVLSKQSADELETAYVEWTVQNTEGVWFNVYYMADNGSTWTKLDDPLVRQYADFYRADMVGLKAGTYKMKIVPTVDNEEVSGIETIANNITVKAHDRSGYGFADSKVPGAYNLDGTLKSGAKVIYVTNENVNTITLTTGRGERVGLHSILGEGYLEKNGDTTPLCVRLIGDVKHTTDLDIKGLTTQGVTIEGIGNDANMNGWGIHLTRSSNVEVRNLGLMNTVGGTLDNIGSESDCSYLWIHNCDLFYGGAGGDSDQAKGDGSLDSKGTDFATYSYNHFWDCGKSNLLGNGSSEEGTSSEGGRTHLSYHHNWYDHSDSRHPRIRSATVHVYNNYFDGNAKYGVGVTRGASAFVENNYFRSTAKMKPMMSSLQGTDISEGKANATFSGEPGGIIKSFNNKIVGSDVRLVTYQQDNTQFDCYEATTRDEQVPATVKNVSGGNTYNNFDTSTNFKNLYKATVETPDDAKVTCERYAGRVDGGDFKWEFDNATEDANYSLIKELKNALVAYRGGVIRIGDVTVSSGSGSTGGSTGGETGGETGGSTGGSTTTPVEGDAIIYCASGDASLTENGVTISGNYKDITVTVDGKSFSPLKMESATSVKFTLSGTYTIKMYMVDNSGVAAASMKIKVNGTAYTSGSDGIATAENQTGEITITKGGSCNLCYIALTKTA